jgi:hypothetical protein
MSYEFALIIVSKLSQLNIFLNNYVCQNIISDLGF